MAVGLNPNSTINKNDDKIKAALQEDYARVEIYYQTLNLKTIRQSPTISVCIKKDLLKIINQVINYHYINYVTV